MAIQVAEDNDQTGVLTDEQIRAVMVEMQFDTHCCNSYWPPAFARRIEREVVQALRAAETR